MLLSSYSKKKKKKKDLLLNSSLRIITIRKFIALFFLFIVCCHCKCGWGGSRVYVAIWLLFFSVHSDFTRIALLIPTLMWSSAILYWTGRNKERKWKSFRGLTESQLFHSCSCKWLSSYRHLHGKTFSACHLGCSALKLRLGPALQGSRLPPLQTFLLRDVEACCKGELCTCSFFPSCLRVSEREKSLLSSPS